MASILDKYCTSQLVSRIQPCEDDLEIKEGEGEPWIPKDGLDNPIHTLPTGLLGPYGSDNGFKLLPWMKFLGL